MSGPDLVLQAGAIVAGIGAYTAAYLGWLGWRLSGRPAAAVLGGAVALFGAAVASFVISGVRADGLVAFTVVSALVIAAAVAFGRGVRGRWPTAGPVALAAIPVALIVPSVGSVLLNTLMPIAAIAFVLWLALQLRRT